jgi:hypothetical protein
MTSQRYDKVVAAITIANPRNGRSPGIVARCRDRRIDLPGVALVRRMSLS